MDCSPAGLLCPWHSQGKNIPSPGELPDPGTEPKSSVLAGRFFTTEPPGKPVLQTGVRLKMAGTVKF